MKNIFLGMSLIFLQLSRVFVVVLSHKQEVAGQWEQKYQAVNKKHHAVAQIFCYVAPGSMAMPIHSEGSCDLRGGSGQILKLEILKARKVSIILTP